MLANADPWILTGIAVGMQWIAAIPAVIFQSEKFYDGWGSVTFLTTSALSMISLIQGFGSFAAAVSSAPRSVAVHAMVIFWTLRLGSFLVTRMARDGKDKRFDQIKLNIRRFIVVWTMQGLWVTMDALPAWILANASLRANSGEAGLLSGEPMGPVDYVLIGIWLAMFASQSLADTAKYSYKQVPESERPTPWIQSGLWSLSRHPNYAAEIIMWWMLATVAARGLQSPLMFWSAQLSPAFITLLLYLLTGPMLEKDYAERYASNPKYQAYVRSTPYILPLIPCPVDPLAAKAK